MKDLTRLLQFREQYSTDQYHLHKTQKFLLHNSRIYFLLLILFLYMMIGLGDNQSDDVDEGWGNRSNIFEYIIVSLQLFFSIILIFIVKLRPMSANKVLIALNVGHSILVQILLRFEEFTEEDKNQRLQSFWYGEFMLLIQTRCIKTTSFVQNTICTILNRTLTVGVFCLFTAVQQELTLFVTLRQVFQLVLTGVMMIYFDYGVERVDRESFLRKMSDTIWRNTSKNIVNEALIISHLSPQNELQLFSCNQTAMSSLGIKSTTTFIDFLSQMQLQIGESVFNSQIFDSLTFKRTFCNLREYLLARHAQLKRRQPMSVKRTTSHISALASASDKQKREIEEYFVQQNLIQRRTIKQLPPPPLNSDEAKREQQQSNTITASLTHRILFWFTTKLKYLFSNDNGLLTSRLYKTKQSCSSMISQSQDLVNRRETKQLHCGNKEVDQLVGPHSLTYLLCLSVIGRMDDILNLLDDDQSDETKQQPIDTDYLHCTMNVFSPGASTAGTMKQFKASVFSYGRGPSGEKSPLIILCIEDISRNESKNLKEQLLENKHFISNILTFFSNQLKTSLGFLNENLKLQTSTAASAVTSAAAVNALHNSSMQSGGGGVGGDGGGDPLIKDVSPPKIVRKSLLPNLFNNLDGVSAAVHEESSQLHDHHYRRQMQQQKQDKRQRPTEQVLVAKLNEISVKLKECQSMYMSRSESPDTGKKQKPLLPSSLQSKVVQKIPSSSSSSSTATTKKLMKICHITKVITVKSLIQISNYADCYRLRERKPLPLSLSEFSLSQLILNTFYFNRKPTLVFNSIHKIIKSDQRRLVQVIFNIINFLLQEDSINGGGGVSNNLSIKFIVTDEYQDHLLAASTAVPAAAVSAAAGIAASLASATAAKRLKKKNLAASDIVYHHRKNSRRLEAAAVVSRELCQSSLITDSVFESEAHIKTESAKDSITEAAGTAPSPPAATQKKKSISGGCCGMIPTMKVASENTRKASNNLNTAAAASQAITYNDENFCAQTLCENVETMFVQTFHTNCNHRSSHSQTTLLSERFNEDKPLILKNILADLETTRSSNNNQQHQQGGQLQQSVAASRATSRKNSQIRLLRQATKYVKSALKSTRSGSYEKSKPIETNQKLSAPTSPVSSREPHIFTREAAAIISPRVVGQSNGNDDHLSGDAGVEDLTREGCLPMIKLQPIREVDSKLSEVGRLNLLSKIPDIPTPYAFLQTHQSGLLSPRKDSEISFLKSAKMGEQKSQRGGNDYLASSNQLGSEHSALEQLKKSLAVPRGCIMIAIQQEENEERSERGGGGGLQGWKSSSKTNSENETIQMLATNEIIKLLGPNKKMIVREDMIAFFVSTNLEQTTSLTPNFLAGKENFEENLDLKEIMNSQAVETIQRVDRAITIDAGMRKTVYTVKNQPHNFKLHHDHSADSLSLTSRKQLPQDNLSSHSVTFNARLPARSLSPIQPLNFQKQHNSASLQNHFPLHSASIYNIPQGIMKHKSSTNTTVAQIQASPLLLSP